MPADGAGVPATTARPRMTALRVGQRLGNRYVVQELLGHGGMGVVFRATDEKLHEDVALKEVRDAYALGPRLREEVRLAQRVSHRNVCRTFDLEEVDGYHLVKMEYVPGETLAQVLRREGKLPIDRALVIVRALASGLAAAHAEGIIHRDLKPANVMVSGDRIVLMDFGLAQRIDEDDRSTVGTPSYMAPELVAGGAVDERTDLYALGCVAFELLTGERVFEATKTTELLEKHEVTEPRALDTIRPGTPRWLTRAVGLLLAKDPAARPRVVETGSEGEAEPSPYLRTLRLRRLGRSTEVGVRWSSRLMIVSRVRSSRSPADSRKGRTSAARTSHRTDRSRARTAVTQLVSSSGADFQPV